jgi:DNA-binding response OmpR family regulator
VATGNQRLRGAARVLVVARPALAELIRVTLGHGQYEVQLATSVDDAEERKHAWHPHLLFVDLDLKDRPLRLVGEIINARRVPAIVLTSGGGLRAKLEAFDRGADDFLELPINSDELVARAHAVIRRTYGNSGRFEPVIQVAGLEIDLLDRVVRANGSDINLTETEQSLLYLLASNAGTTLERATILDAIWGADFVADSNLVDRHVRNLRVKLGDDWHKPRFIETVARHGYRFISSPARGERS